MKLVEMPNWTIVRSDFNAEWVIFDGCRQVGRVADWEVIDMSPAQAHDYLRQRIADLRGEMGSLYAIADEAKVASRGAGE